MIMKTYLIFVLLISTMVSCVDSARSGGRNLEFPESNNNNSAASSLNCTAGEPVSGSNPCLNALEAQPEVELTHFINPYNGSYVRKLTLPKNYDGPLYIAGLNLGTLSNRNLRVRFTFGRDRTPVTLNATVGKGQGATAGVVVDVIIVDLQRQDFGTLQLFYSLFDYNEYEMDLNLGVSNEREVAQDPRDPGLYCRGLNLEDDPTFNNTVCNANASGIDGSCVYSYAQIGDKSLTRRVVSGSGDFFYTLPTSPQLSSSESLSYYANSDADILKRCLPDEVPGKPVSAGSSFSLVMSDPFLFSNRVSDGVRSFSDFVEIENIAGVDYRYAGPFRTINKDQWALPSGLESALFGRYGLFHRTYAQASDSLDTKLERGVVSNLFPRFTKYEVRRNLEHLATASSTAPGTVKEVRSLNISGETNWTDGCNARVRSLDSFTQENIGSCNITAKIEILHQDFELQKQILILESQDLKLQLIKDADYSSEEQGSSTLANSFSVCSSNSQCGSDSCCFNGRCWSNTIVSQCLDETNQTGNSPVGTSCTSDLQCSSLCCDQGSGRCNVHTNSDSNNPVLCNKQAGQSCIAREWCAKQTLPECYIVSTGPGNTDCEYRCYNVERFGDCVNNSCLAPQPRVDDSALWNPSDPNRCNNARDPAQTPPPFN